MILYHNIVMGIKEQRSEYYQWFSNILYVDSNCTSQGQNLIMYVTLESLCCMLGTSIILYIKYTSVK